MDYTTVSCNSGLHNSELSQWTTMGYIEPQQITMGYSGLQRHNDIIMTDVRIIVNRQANSQRKPTNYRADRQTELQTNY